MALNAVRAILLCWIGASAPVGLTSQELVGRLVGNDTRGGLGGGLLVLVDSGNVLIGATEADSRGQFRFQDVASGRYRLLGQEPEYGTGSLDFLLGSGGDHLVLEIHLVRRIRAVEPTKMLENVGFFQRGELSAGRFLVEDQIVDLAPIDLEDLVNRVSGTGGSWAQNGDCEPVLVLNGHAIKAGRDRPVVEALGPFINVDSLIGLEVYPSAVEGGPVVRYGNVYLGCGGIVVWTR